MKSDTNDLIRMKAGAWMKQNIHVGIIFLLVMVLLSGCIATPLPLGTIRGEIVEEPGRAIKGATVSVLGTEKSIKTDEDGFFELKGVLTGQRTVKVTHDDYEDYRFNPEFKANKPLEYFDDNAIKLTPKK